MENISDQALQAFLRNKIDPFEKHERGLGYGEANLRTRVQGAKDFVDFVFGGRPGRQRRRRRRVQTSN